MRKPQRRMLKVRHRRAPPSILTDDDPLAGVVNLFDVAIVFAMGLIVALVMAMRNGHYENIAEGASTPSEIEVRRGERLVRYRVSRETARGGGRRLGVAYQLPDGQMVYVPEEQARPRE